MKKSVLIIDDVGSICELLQEVLSIEGYEIFTVLTGGEGLEIVERKKPPVLILDIALGDMTGLDLLESVKNKHPEIEAIMMNGYTTIDIVVDSVRLGAFGYFRKPFQCRELVKKCGECFEYIALREENETKSENVKLRAQMGYLVRECRILMNEAEYWRG